MSINIEKLEELTEARKKTWRELLGAIGADNSAQAYAKQCREAMNAAASADEAANSALHSFLRRQSEEST